MLFDVPFSLIINNASGLTSALGNSKIRPWDFQLRLNDSIEAGLPVWLCASHSAAKRG